MTQLEKELNVYNQNKDRLLKEGHESFFVLIKDDQIVGLFKTAEDAYSEGLKKFGNVPMFIKQVLKEDPPQSAPALFFGLMNARS